MFMLPWGQRAYHIGLVPMGSTWCGVEPMLHKRQWVTGSEMQVLPSRFMLKFLGGLKLKGELSCQSENLGIWGGMEGSESSRILATDWRVWTLSGSPGGLPQYPAWDSFSTRIYSGSLGWKLTLCESCFPQLRRFSVQKSAGSFLVLMEFSELLCSQWVFSFLFSPGEPVAFIQASLHSLPPPHLPPEPLMGLLWISTWGPAGPGVACRAGAQSSLGVYCLPSPQASRSLASRRLTHLLWCQLGSSLSIFCVLGNHFRGYLFSFA